MFREKISFFAIISFVIIMSSCHQNDVSYTEVKPPKEEIETVESPFTEPHQYGGWFCPDNLGGFPPVDIQDLDEIPVVLGRLPSQEETRNGTSLMYFDTSVIADARPLEMDLPKVARVYSSHNEMDELIIVIQAVVAGTDTVVGYRYPHGGNGSAWYAQVTFLSDDELHEIGDNPFVYIDEEIRASKKEIWKAISKTEYITELGQRFGEQVFFASEWTPNSKAHLNYELGNERGTGIVASHWGNLYMHVDYDFNGFHFSEKLLVIENENKQTSELHLVSGPYPNDIKKQRKIWKKWLEEVKTNIETN